MLVAAVVMTVLLLLRNTIAVPYVEAAIEGVLSNELERPVRVDIDRISGSWLSDLSLHRLRVSTEGPDPLSFSASRVRVSYRLMRLIGAEPLTGLQSLEVDDGRAAIALDGLPGTADPLPPEDRPDHPLVAALRAMPHHLEIDVDLSAEVQLDPETPVNARVALVGSSAEGLFVRLALPESQPAVPWDTPVESRLMIRGSPDHLFVESADGTSPANLLVSADLRVVSEYEVAGTVSVSVHTDSLSAEAQVGDPAATLMLRYEPADLNRADALPSRIATDALELDLVVGSAVVTVDLVRHPDEARSLTNLLMTDPELLVEVGDVSMSGLLTDWEVAGVRGIDVDMEAAWTNAMVSLSRLVVTTESGARVAARGQADLDAMSVSEAHIALQVPQVAEFRPLLTDLPAWAEELSGTIGVEADVRRVVVADTPDEILRSLDADLSIRGSSLRVDDFGVAEMEVAATVAGRIMTVSRLVATTDNGATIRAGGIVDLEAEAVSGIDVTLEVPDLAEIAMLLRDIEGVPGELGGSFAAEARIRSAAAAPTFDAMVATIDADVSVRVSSLRIDEVAVDELTLDAALADRVVNLSRLSAVTAGGSQIHGRGRIDLEDEAASDASVEIEIPDIAELRRLLPDAPDWAADLAGRVTAHAQVRRVTAADTFEEVLETVDAEFAVRGTRLHVNGVDVADLRLDATVANRQLHVSRLFAMTDGRTSVDASGRFDLETEVVTDVLAVLEIPELETLIAILPEADLPEWVNGLSGSLDAQARVERVRTADTVDEILDSLDAAVVVRGSSLRAHGYDVAELVLDATMTDGFVQLSRFAAVTAGGVTVEGRGGLDAITPTLTDVFVSISVPELSEVAEYAAAFGDPGTAPDLAGTFALEARVRRVVLADTLDELLETLDADMTIRAASVRLDDLDIGSVEIDVEAEAGIVEVRRAALESEALRAAISATAVPRADGVAVDLATATVWLADRPGPTLELTEPALIDISPDAIAVSTATFSTPGGRVSIGGRLDGQEIDLTTTASSFSIEEALELADVTLPVTGVMAWNVRATGSFDEPRFSVRFETTDAEYEGRPAEVSINLGQDASGVYVERLLATLEGRLEATAHGRLPVFVGADGVRTVGLGEHSFSMTGQADALSEWLPAEFHPYLPAEHARLRAVIEEVDGGPVANLEIAAARQTDGMEADARRGLSAVALSARLVELPEDRVEVSSLIDLDGERAAELIGIVVVPGLSAREPVFAPEGIALDVSIEADLPVADAAAYVPDVILAGGTIRATASIGGTLVDPEIRGRLEVRQGELRLAGPMPAVSALNARIEFRGDTILIDSFTAEFGRSPFAVSGSVGLPGDDSDGHVDIRVAGDNLLLFSDPSIRVRADVNIQVSESLLGPRVSGEVVVREAEYREDVALIDFGAPPALDPGAFQIDGIEGDWAEASVLDITVRGDRSILVRNNVFDGRLSVDAHVQGSLQVPILTGRIFTETARVRLPLTDVDLSMLLVEFPPATPFEPRIDAFGTSQIRGYEVFVQASGTLATLELEVSSSPMLPRDQAILLLTTGYADFFDVGLGERAVRTLGEFLGRRLVNVLFGETPVEREVLDRLDVVVGRRLSGTGAEILEVEFRLDQDQNWFLNLERDRHDDINVGIAWRLTFD